MTRCQAKLEYSDIFTTLNIKVHDLFHYIGLRKNNSFPKQNMKHAYLASKFHVVIRLPNKIDVNVLRHLPTNYQL